MVGLPFWRNHTKMTKFPSFWLPVSTGFMFCLGRIYSLTMLYNLNYRSSQQESTNTTDVLSLERSQTLNNTKGIREYLPGIIHTGTCCGSLIIICSSDVHRTTAVHDGSQVRLHIALPILFLSSLKLMLTYRLAMAQCRWISLIARLIRICFRPGKKFMYYH